MRTLEFSEVGGWLAEVNDQTKRGNGEKGKWIVLKDKKSDEVVEVICMKASNVTNTCSLILYMATLISAMQLKPYWLVSPIDLMATARLNAEENGFKGRLGCAVCGGEGSKSDDGMQAVSSVKKK